MKTFAILLGLYGFTLLAEPVINEADRMELQERCFVWRKAKCRPGHFKADDVLVKSVTKQFSREEASKQITKHAWELLQVKRQPEKALTRFNQALVVNEKSAEAWWGAGTAAAELKLNEDALRLLQNAVAINPKLPQAHFNLARLFLTWKRDLNSAEKSAEHAVTADPEFRDGWKLLSLIQFNGRKFSLAKTSYERAIKLGAVKEPEFEMKLEKALAKK